MRRLRRAGWKSKLGALAATLVLAPLLGIALIYVLPAETAVALAKPVLAALSDAPPLPEALTPVPARSVLLAADGSELSTLSPGAPHARVRLDDVADVVVDALLAAEDDAFYDHPGIDHRSVIRAALVNLRSGLQQGRTTLTQQLVENLYLDGSRSGRRAFTQSWYALELEERLSKDDILERYLNEAYFGNGASGIAAAASVYFNTTPDRLDLPQAATLVGILPAPSRRNPVDDLDESRRARNRVLNRMVETGRLDEGDRLRARSADMGVVYRPPPQGDAAFVVELVRHHLLTDERFDRALGTDPVERERVIFGGGLVVHSTFDGRLQDVAHQAIEDHTQDPATSPLAAVVAVDPREGAVRAVAVGPHAFGVCRRDRPDCPRTLVNPVSQGLGGRARTSGSAFTPVVLAAALAEGVPPGWQQRTAEVDIPGCSNDARPYRPATSGTSAGVKDMREALRVGDDVYAARLAGRVGPATVGAVARELGLEDASLPTDCSIAVGSARVFPLSLTAAYATLANEGEHCTPTVVTRLELSGAELGTYQPECDPRVDARVAVQLTDLLRDPVVDATAAGSWPDGPVAGMTGTSDNAHDAWFVGYVPQLAAAAWVGYEQPAPMVNVLDVARVTGASIPARIWGDFMTEATAGLASEPFREPEPVDDITVPDFTGQDAADVVADTADSFDLNIERSRVRSRRDRGTVVRQAPAPATRVPPGALVTLFVSDGKGERRRDR